MKRTRRTGKYEPTLGTALVRDEIDTALAGHRRRSVGSSLPIRDRLPRRAIAAALVALCLAGVGVGGYLIGHSPEVDLDAVRSAATAEGREQGTEIGMEEGYRQGFRAARKGSYGSAYSAAYKQAYADEFASAGFDPPERIPIPGRR